MGNTILLKKSKDIIKLSESGWSILAAIRFILASIVLLSHIHFYVKVPNIIEPLTQLGGKAAVLGFLMISGISVGHSYLKSKDGYFSRRFLRIYPLYFFAVLFTVIIQIIVGTPYQLPGETFAAAGLLTSFANFLFLQGFFAIPITYNQPLWSLSVEVFFYLILPFWTKISTKFIVFIIILSIITYSLTYSFFELYMYGYVAWIYLWPWLIGFLIIKIKKIKLITLLLILGIFAVYYNRIIALESYNWLTFLVIVIFVLVTLTKEINVPSKLKRGFNYLGELSYPLYLFHVPFCILLYFLGVRNIWAFLFFLIISIIPINYLLDHWLKRIFWKPIVKLIENKVNIF